MLHPYNKLQDRKPHTVLECASFPPTFPANDDFANEVQPCTAFLLQVVLLFLYVELKNGSALARVNLKSFLRIYRFPLHFLNAAVNHVNDEKLDEDSNNITTQADFLHFFSSTL